MLCPSCRSSNIQTVTTFNSKWFAANVIEQRLLFVCMDCGRRWEPPEPKSESFSDMFRTKEDKVVGVGCLAVILILLYFVGTCPS
jgi:hypothetical protein